MVPPVFGLMGVVYAAPEDIVEDMEACIEDSGLNCGSIAAVTIHYRRENAAENDYTVAGNASDPVEAMENQKGAYTADADLQYQLEH